MISAIILSAGLNTRFGSPKALAKWSADNTVIEKLQKALLESEIDQIIIVLGAYSKKIKSYILNHKSIEFVHNKDYKFGQTSSFKTGVRRIKDDTKGILLFPVDYPAVKTGTIRYLVDIFNEKKPDILIPAFNSRKGHPPVFSAQLKERFLSIDNNEGINSVFKEYGDSTLVVPVNDAGVITTFNTPEEFEGIIKE